MPRYLLSVIQPDGGLPPPEVLARVSGDLAVLNRELESAGAWVFAAGLEPASSATVIRVRGGKVLQTDGPFAETKEHVGGFWLIEVPDRAAALEWARKASEASTLPIETRQLRDD